MRWMRSDQLYYSPAPLTGGVNGRRRRRVHELQPTNISARSLVCVCPQDVLSVWSEPKLCVGGAALPEKETLPCEGVEFWVRLGAGLGAFAAALLVSLTCYFWKKNKRFV